MKEECESESKTLRGPLIVSHLFLPFAEIKLFCSSFSFIPPSEMTGPTSSHLLQPSSGSLEVRRFETGLRIGSECD